MEGLKKIWKRGKNVFGVTLAILIELIVFWKQLPIMLMNVLLFFVVLFLGIFEFQSKKKNNPSNEFKSSKSDFFATVITVGITALISNIFHMNNLGLSDIRLYCVIGWSTLVIIALLGYITDRLYCFFYERKTHALMQAHRQSTPINEKSYSQHSFATNFGGNANISPVTLEKTKISIRFKEHIKKSIPFIILLLILGSFLGLPLFSTKKIITQWFEGIDLLIKSFIGSDETNSENLLTYICVFIVVAVIFVVFSTIIFNLISNHFFKKRNSVIFLSEEYNNSIITLITCVAAIRTFVGNESNGEVDFLAKSWEFALMAIFVLLLLTMLIEIVHLALDQGVRHDSLLRLCIRYIFILVVKCFVDIIIGVLSNLHLRDVLSSIFSSSLYTGKNNVFDKVIKKIDIAIDNEVQQLSTTQKNKNRIVLNVSQNNTRISTRRKVK